MKKKALAMVMAALLLVGSLVPFSVSADGVPEIPTESNAASESGAPSGMNRLEAPHLEIENGTPVDEEGDGTPNEAGDDEQSTPVESPEAGDAGIAPLADDQEDDSPTADDTTGEGEKAREAHEFSLDDAITKLKFSVTSEGKNVVYEIASGQQADTKADFPDGLARDASYAATIDFALKDMAEKEDLYPFVSGDTFVAKVPALLRHNTTFEGRLRDTTVLWDSQHGGVGDYEIEGDKLTLTFDDGYLEETGGKVVASSVQIAGGFDLSEQPTDAFETALGFGGAVVNTSFKALTVKRNVSIQKKVKKYGVDGNSRGPYFSSGSGAAYPLDKSIVVGNDGFITYTITVKADETNTVKLTNVKVTDVFAETDQSKVIPDSMALQSVTVDGEDRTAAVEPLYDEANHLEGWNIGDLEIGSEATIVYKVQIDPEGISEAVKQDKDAQPDTAAEEARTITNTASVTAEGITEAVTATASGYVRNYLSITKHLDSYDSDLMRQYFRIEISVPKDNKYTMVHVPIVDYPGYTSDHEFYKASGIESVQVKNPDGKTEEMQLEFFEEDGTGGWKAVLPELRPNAKVTIRSYIDLSEKYWTEANKNGSGQIGQSRFNYARIDPSKPVDGYYAKDIYYRLDDIIWSLRKTVLSKNQPSIGSTGLIHWTITGNVLGSNVPQFDFGGQTLVDTLGENQAFQGNATITFYRYEGTKRVKAWEDTIVLDPEATRFSYVIPEEYGTCEYQISYTTQATDWESYVGPSKPYYNKVAIGSWLINASTYARSRVAGFEKLFVDQGYSLQGKNARTDWARWTIDIWSPVEAGDTLVDAVRDSSKMYYTQSDLDGISLTIDGIAVDPGLYEIVPGGSITSGFKGFTVQFKAPITVVKDGATLTPSKANPLHIAYQSTLKHPSSGSGNVDYYNDATLTVGTSQDTDNDYARRRNKPEIVKEKYSTSNSKVLVWKIRANYYGYAGQPDGTALLTEQLPKGVEFLDAKKLDGVGDLAVQSVTTNDDGSTTVQIALSNLYHDEVSKNHTSDLILNTPSKELHMLVRAKITDPAYLYGSSDQTFDFTNVASLHDRYGILKEGKYTISLQNLGLDKGMTYNEATAPYAQFSIDVNPNALDLNPDGDQMAVVDRTNEALRIVPDSYEVIDKKTGESVAFTIDSSGAAQHTFVLQVPDERHLEIRYQAEVSGVPGTMVAVSNVAYFQGHEDQLGPHGKVEEELLVLKSAGLAVSEPMVWFEKRDEKAELLPNALYSLSEWNEETQTWSEVQKDLKTVDKATSPRGLKVESLTLNTLYKLVETQAPAGYVLDTTPHYFVLFGETAPTVTYPADLDAQKVQLGASGSVVTAYDVPFTDVTFSKTDANGARLAGAKFEVHVESADGEIARDAMGQEVTFTSAADVDQKYTLAPGRYVLVETEAPEGYQIAESVAFEVKGNASRDVVVDDQVVDAVVLQNEVVKQDVSVEKVWNDADNQDGKRPETVIVTLYANGEATEQSLTLSAVNEWKGTFAALPMAKDGTPIVYTVQEDAVDGYTSEVTGDATQGFVVTNVHEAETLTVTGAKTWEDQENQDRKRPESLTIRLLANGVEQETREVGAADNWSWTFENLPRYAAGQEITYTITEDAVPDYTATVNGYDVTNTHTPDQTSVQVTKAWQDANNQDGKRPESVVVHLVADGEDTGKTVTLTAESNWTATFTELPVYANGQKIEYTVVEDTVDGYTSVVTGDATQGFVVTNTHTPTPSTPNNPTPNKPNKPVNPTPNKPNTPEKPSTPDNPQTGDSSWWLLAMGLFLGAAALYAGVRKRWRA